MLTHLDLCSGIGGFKLAAEWAGFETVGLSEVERYCCQLLKEKWPDIRNYGDLRGADFTGLKGRVTVVSAGVPCQPASCAGKRRGEADDRWLWGAVCDVVGVVEPAWCIFENPVGILTLDEFGGVLLRLGALGYAFRAFSVPANAVGARHRRQRVFIVANADSVGGERDPGQLRQNGFAECSGEVISYARLAGLPESERETILGERWGIEGRTASEFCWRLTESPLCGRADGVSGRVDRLKGLGNAVVPQCAYPFFSAIAQVEEQFR